MPLATSHTWYIVRVKTIPSEAFSSLWIFPPLDYFNSNFWATFDWTSIHHDTHGISSGCNDPRISPHLHLKISSPHFHLLKSIFKWSIFITLNFSPLNYSLIRISKLFFDLNFVYQEVTHSAFSLLRNWSCPLVKPFPTFKLFIPFLRLRKFSHVDSVTSFALM